MIRIKVVVICSECSRETEGHAALRAGRLDVRWIEEPGWRVTEDYALCPEHRFRTEANRDND